MRLAVVLGSLVILSFLSGCDSGTPTPNNEESLTLTVAGMHPARTGEIYALWIAFPKAGTSPKHGPQHGSSEYKLVSTFDVDASGNITGLDASDLKSKLGVSLALAQHGLISIEKKDSIRSVPTIPFLVGEIAGTASQGIATMTHDHSEAIGYTFSTLSASATLASPASAPDDYNGELYLMNATSAVTAEASISGLVPLPLPWKFGLWAVDSTSGFTIFYGYFADVAQADSNPDDNHFPFPGGRYPASPTDPVYHLNSGNTTILVTLEPNFSYARPEEPFGAVVLKAQVPPDQPAFSPFPLTNTSIALPKASLILNR